ncbi:MAG: hypothetical protein QOF55_1823, partial [Thermoleophilaceae bacterium]|nr:hypothetical protein [Thermoleophilaceae bacterium]
MGATGHHAARRAALLGALLLAGAGLLAPGSASAAPLTVNGATLFSTVNGSMAGSSVARAGDVNGDGVTDL